ncbi:Thiosulfate sulfurtransferase PspE precursor [compost metagenome]
MKKIMLLFLITFLEFTSFAYGKEVYLDVRTPKEYEEEHVPQAINIDVLNANFKTEVAKLNRDDDYKVYCRSGKRTAQAIAIMKDLDFKHMENLGGLEDAKKVYNKAHPTGK